MSIESLIWPGGQHQAEGCRVPGCQKCDLKRPFTLPKDLVDACERGEVVLFAGAGISTESRGVYPSSFYENIRAEMGLRGHARPSFPELMSRYCSPPRSRKDLLRAIKSRIDYLYAFPELYDSATEFHRALATIPHLDEIFTTNWDDFFERECDATPIVTGDDFGVFQDISGRKVFKLHGSINNYGSIIATEGDYLRCYRMLTTKTIGAKLKLLLVSRTLLFVGFSFEDEDFRRLYRLVSKDVGGIMPACYVVTLDSKAGQKMKSLGLNATPILTDATYFLSVLKDRLVKDKFMLSDVKYYPLPEAIRTVAQEHERTMKLSLARHPDVVYSLIYQDGILHALEHLLSTRKSGVLSHFPRIQNQIRSYDILVKRKLHEGNYLDVAYFTGYVNGLVHFVLGPQNITELPQYFLFGYGETPSQKEFLKLEPESATRHKSAHKLALAVAKSLGPNLTPHHRPFLT